MSARRRRRMMAQINVVPYIDVSLVLLIIFMITAPLLTRGVEVSLPRAAAKPLSQKELAQHEPVVLTVDKNGGYHMNIGPKGDKPISGGLVVALVEKTLQQSPDTPVLVRGDKGASYGDVLQGMTLLQAAGAQNVGLITDPHDAPQVNKAGP